MTKTNKILTLTNLIIFINIVMFIIQNNVEYGDVKFGLNIYFFKYEPYNNRIVGNIKGYNSFSALVTKKDELLKNNTTIKDIYIDRYVGDDGIKFIIELKERVKVNIIDVEDPGSIIIELYPLKSK